MNSNELRDKLIAAATTIVVAIILLLWLSLETINWDKDAALAQNQNIIEQEEELFIEPELLNLGEPDALAFDEPAPAPQGEPEESQEQIDKIVTPGESEKPTNATEKLVAAQKESPVTTKEPAKTEEPESKISSAMKDKFSPKNGKTDGKNDSAGAGGTGAGVVGSINGRTFKGCALPSVKVNKPVTIYVSIVVDESGKVIDAQFKSDKGAGAGNQALRNACVKASYNARWSEKKGEPRAKGTLTWNLKPRS